MRVLVAVALGAVALAGPSASSQAASMCLPGSKQVIYVGKRKCLTLTIRERIYWELTHYQDTHPGQDDQAYIVMAKRWRIPLSSVRLVAVEGSSKLWPIPPVP